MIVHISRGFSATVELGVFHVNGSCKLLGGGRLSHEG
jgi:hypothetical protein